MRKVAAIVLLLSFTSIMVVESGFLSMAEINGLELLEQESNNDSENEAEKDKSKKDSSDEFFKDVSKYLLASEITSKAFNSIRFNLDGAYQKIVVPPPEA